MYHSALMAKDAFLEEHPDAMQIEVIDSNCYSVGYGYPIMQQACQRALEGESFEDVLAYIRDYLRRVCIYFSPFTLKYVKKVGPRQLRGGLRRRADRPAPGDLGGGNDQ